MGIQFGSTREYSVRLSISFELQGGKLDVADLRDGVYFAIRKAIALDTLTERGDAPAIVSFDVSVQSRLESSRA